jgi:hypothetical protein
MKIKNNTFAQLILNYFIMRKNLFFAGIIILAVIFIGCNKPKITCEIVQPTSDAIFEIGEMVNLAVTVEVENTTIDNVQVYLDDVGYAQKSFFPFNFQISTQNMKKGAHTIRVVALATSGDKDERNVSFNLTKEESPNFISFSDGMFPKGWSSWGCTISSPGYDDDYCVNGMANYFDPYLSTQKSCGANINCVEFYAKGSSSYWSTPYIRIYVDDLLVQNFALTDAWEKYSFNISQGEHTFKWELLTYSSGDYISIDAIKFFKK